MAYYFDGNASNRFEYGLVAATPTEYSVSVWVKWLDGTTGNIILRSSPSGPTSAWSHDLGHNNGGLRNYIYDGSTKSTYGSTTLIKGQWFHVVATAKNGGYNRLYVNGLASGTPVAVGTIWKAGTNWHISVVTGHNYQKFNGELSDLCLWYKELTPQEIWKLYKGTRITVLSMWPQHRVLYLPMNDRNIGTVISSPWTNVVHTKCNQILTNTVVSRPDNRLNLSWG